MNKDRLALQAYTIRDFCRTEADFENSMARVAAIGYAAVQISNVGPIPPARIRAICEDRNLTICATHESGADIVERPEAVAERLGALGASYTAYPFPHVAMRSPEDVEALSTALEKAGKVLADAGKRLAYHNHNLEFIKLANGRIALDMIYENTHPKHLAGELDTYWVQAAGASPVEWIRRLSGRLPLLHLKDAAVFWNDEGKAELRETSIGDGNLDWKRIVRAADEAGTEWFIVEQDGNWEGGDPFAAAEKSFAYLSENIREHAEEGES